MKKVSLLLLSGLLLVACGKAESGGAPDGLAARAAEGAGPSAQAPAEAGLDPALLAYYRLPAGSAESDGKARGFEERRAALADALLVNKYGQEGLDAMQAKYGAPVSVETRKIQNMHYPEQTDYIDTYVFKGIEYRVYRVKGEIDGCMLAYCKVTPGYSGEDFSPLFGLTRAELEAEYGATALDSGDIASLEPYTQDNAIDYGIKAVFKDGKVAYLEYTMLF